MGIFKVQKFSMGFLWGVNFWSRNFLGFWFLPPFNCPHHLIYKVLPLGQDYWLELIRPQKFCPKMCFEASRAVFWSLSCYKELKLTIKPFTGHTLHNFLIQMQNISLGSSGMHKAQFLAQWDSSLDFYFSLSLLPSFLAFLASFFFLLLGI